MLLKFKLAINVVICVGYLFLGMNVNLECEYWRNKKLYDEKSLFK
jgi:hypothetical protein